ncbi:type IV pilin [Halosegnis longus]|uniref:type IV pilin n=1 Tax=Halosegnis longus TaxID=2216012 RepID=UPI00129E7A0A|nr:type IV pilin N-terminal domain-containing protein [Halosegnis longus]
MNIKQLFNDDSAVSPVIGVILMVAITVILAAVIGTFVLGLGSNVQSTPTAQFDFEYNSGTVTVTHEGGDSIDPGTLSITDNDGGSTTWSSYSGSSVSSGDSQDFTYNGAATEIRVIWEPQSGDTSQTLATSEVP